MEIYISYFYQVRFFLPHMIPLSTAKWDPKWFHDFKDQSHTFIDKRGVLNGLRATPFAPGPTCENLCHGLENCIIGDTSHCDFIYEYEKQLDALDFDDIMRRIESIVQRSVQYLKCPGDPIAILLVHEAPQNLCSERCSIKHWFYKHGVIVKEWEPLDGI